MHSLIAQKLMHQPSLIDKARHNAERWLRRYGGDQPEYLIEWQQILARPIAEVAAIIVSQTEEAVRLRQSSPFAGFLTPAERRRVYEAFRA